MCYSEENELGQQERLVDVYGKKYFGIYTIYVEGELGLGLRKDSVRVKREGTISINTEGDVFSNELISQSFKLTEIYTERINLIREWEKAASDGFMKQDNMALHNSDSIEARCNGLKSGYAISEKTGKRVYCEFVTKKDGPFYCPRCNSTAIVRKCSEKEDHFAHKPRLSPILTAKDQSLHTECKNSICNYLSKQFPEGHWAVERDIPASEKLETKKIVPDISGRINNVPVAIEVQKTAYTLNKIREKTEIYNKRGVYVLWIIPLREELGDENFRPRLFEKYLHAMYFGRAYYWVPTKPTRLLPVHYSFSCRYIEPTSFYDEDGEEMSFGGYYLTYKTIKRPNSIGYIDIATELKKVERPLFINKKWDEEIPACKIMMDDKEQWWSKSEKEEMINAMEDAHYQLEDVDSEDWYDSYDYYENDFG